MGSFLSRCTRPPSPPLPYHAAVTRTCSQSPSKQPVQVSATSISRPYPLGAHIRPVSPAQPFSPAPSRYNRSRAFSLPHWNRGRGGVARKDGASEISQTCSRHEGAVTGVEDMWRARSTSPDPDGQIGGRSLEGKAKSARGTRGKMRPRKAVSATTLRASYMTTDSRADCSGITDVEIAPSDTGPGCGHERQAASSPTSLTFILPSPQQPRSPQHGSEEALKRYKPAPNGHTVPCSYGVHFDTSVRTRRETLEDDLHPSDQSGPRPTYDSSTITSPRRKISSLPSDSRSTGYGAKRQVRVDDIPFPLRVSPPRALRYASPSHIEASDQPTPEPYPFCGAGISSSGTEGRPHGQNITSIDSRKANSIASVAASKEQAHDRRATRPGKGRRLQKVHRVEGDWELWQPDDWEGEPLGPG